MACIRDLLSNHSEDGLTPEKLRELAVPHDRQEPVTEPVKFQIHRLSARLSPDLLQSVVERYVAGESARSLAAEMGIAPSALLRLFRELKVAVRPRFVTPEQDEKLARDYQEGMTLVELERKYGISHNAVIRALRRKDVEMRAKGRRTSRSPNGSRDSIA